MLFRSLFDGVRIINQIKDGTTVATSADIEILKELFDVIVSDVLGLLDESAASGSEDLVDSLVQMVLEVRKEAKAKKDFATSDLIRDRLKEAGIQIKDTKDGSEWTKL